MPLDPLPVNVSPSRTLLGATCAFVLFSSLLLINLMQMASLALWPFSRQMVRSINRWCADTWWGWCALTSLFIHRTRPRFEGDTLPQDENAFLLCNHQSMSDIQMLFLLARREGRLGDMKWFVKKQIRKVPGVGWGMVFLDCVFLDRDWTADRERIRSTFARLVDNDVPIWLVSFPEGTRMRPDALESATRFANRSGIEPLEHLLIPRTKGFVATLEGLGDHLDAIYDVTLIYDSGVPSLWQWACGRIDEIRIDVRRHALADLPVSAEDRAAWLQQCYRKKDLRLAQVYAARADR